MITPMFNKFIQYPKWSVATTIEKARRKIFQTNVYQSYRQYFENAPTLIKRPVFIIGTVRSGKTTLARILGNHPSLIYMGYELTAEWCELAKIDIARSENNMAHCPPYTEMDATVTRCVRVRNGFSEIVAEKGGGKKSRLLDDNPHLWNKLPFVRQIFPDAQLVIVSRDIRSTVASTKLLWIKGNATTGKKYYFPENHTHCWSVIPPASFDAMQKRRIFPGGDIAVLAEYWLNTYSMIDKRMKQFDAAVLVKQGANLAHSDAILTEICEAIDVPTLRCPIPELDTARNEHWSEVLTAQEKQELEDFIESNKPRIQKLECAETSL